MRIPNAYRLSSLVGVGSAAAIATMVGFVGSTRAQGEPSSRSMTCAETVRLIRTSGPLVLDTGGQISNRLWRDRSSCEMSEIARRSFAPTQDDPTCFVGYACYEPEQKYHLSD